MHISPNLAINVCVDMGHMQLVVYAAHMAYKGVRPLDDYHQSVIG